MFLWYLLAHLLRSLLMELRDFLINGLTHPLKVLHLRQYLLCQLCFCKNRVESQSTRSSFCIVSKVTGNYFRSKFISGRLEWTTFERNYLIKNPNQFKIAHNITKTGPRNQDKITTNNKIFLLSYPNKSWQ